MFSRDFNVKATKIALLQSKSHRITKHRLAAALKPFDLRSVDWIVLGFLSHEKKPMAISEVAAELGIQSSFMTVTVTKLSDRKLIKITDDAVDRRKKDISLTAEGQKVVRLMQKQFEEFFAPLVRGLTAKELITYVKVLHTITKNMERMSSLEIGSSFSDF